MSPIHGGIALDCPEEDYNALRPELREAFEAIAAESIRSISGQGALVVTSAFRPLRRQAALMAAMSDAELEGMYCRHGRPSYIDELEAARPLDEEKAYRILLNRSEGYISRHLYGQAVDVDADCVADAEIFRTICQRHGCIVLDEREIGRRCLHIAINS